MTELEALIALHGEIDRAVRGDRGLAEVVAPLLPAYTMEDTPGWFEEFERWTRDVAPDASLAGPDAALRELADITPSPRMAARRLLAIAAFSRVHRRPTDDVNPEVLGALSVQGIAAGDNSAALLRRLTSPEFDSIGQWRGFVEAAVEKSELSEMFLAQAGAPPCSGAVEPAVSSSGGVVNAATLFTSNTANVAFDRACRFLDPSNWTDCSDFWCDMTRVATKPNGNPVYHEKVSLDCRNGLAWWAEAFLEFGTSYAPPVASVSYQLDPDRTAATDPIVVDEGWLRVVDEGGGVVTVETLKTIRFANAYVFTPGRIAAMMCPLGYNDAAGDLMFNCADNDAAEGTDFPGSLAADETEG